MDLARVLAQLRSELENIDTAIASLERLKAQNQAVAPPEVTGEVKRRRGRPPKSATGGAEGALAALKQRSGDKQ